MSFFLTSQNIIIFTKIFLAQSIPERLIDTTGHMTTIQNTSKQPRAKYQTSNTIEDSTSNADN